MLVFVTDKKYHNLSHLPKQNINFSSSIFKIFHFYTMLVSVCEMCQNLVKSIQCPCFYKRFFHWLFNWYQSCRRLKISKLPTTFKWFCWIILWARLMGNKSFGTISKTLLHMKKKLKNELNLKLKVLTCPSTSQLPLVHKEPLLWREN